MESMAQVLGLRQYKLLVQAALLIQLLLTLPGCTAQNFHLSLNITEGAALESYVGNVSSAPGFMESVLPEDRGSLLFSFLQQTIITSMLRIQGETGYLYTTVVIDRESLPECRVPTSCVLTFDIAARSKRKDSSLFEIISVSVNVLDINDNVPTFPQGTQVIPIPESAAYGMMYMIDSAEDEDTGANNSIQYYELVGNKDMFSLKVDRKLDGSLTAKLFVNGKLDREKKDFYNCTIIAWDGGKPARFGSMKLNITIEDENDNAPVLSQTSYDISVKESIEPGTGILQVQATDADIGKNGEILFRFSPHQQDLTEIQNLFSINQFTGVLKVIGNLVHVPGKSHKIIVEAMDNGTPQKYSANQAVINVNIEDTGNNPPEVSINLLSSGNGHIKDVSEFSGKGTFVAHVNVVDPDTGPNGIVICSVDGDLFKLESLSNKGFKVVVKGELDRERQDMHTVKITCRDDGKPSLSATESFLVRVTDENDNPPEFSDKNYIQDMYENNDVSNVVLTVAASDKDLGKNGKVHYYLDSFITDYFRIDPVYGIIRAKEVFDRENKTIWTFKVYAMDSGDPPLVGNASVMVRIRDRNDNPPKFSSSTFEFYIKENQPAGTVVDILTATDADQYDNGVFTYAIPNTAEPDLPFLLLPDGTIKNTRELDREAKSRYVFTVIAIDKGSPKLTSSARVIISVIDDNDEKPEIKFPRPDNKTVIIPHMLMKGSYVTQIEAYDQDDGLNKKLTYIIEHGNSENVFDLNVKTGVLTMAKRYRVQEGEERYFNLIIAVQDGGIPQHSERCELQVIIVFSNKTMAEPLEGSGSNSNIAIAVVVSLLTFFLSTAIIVVICVIRKFDRDRMKSQTIQINKLPNNMADSKENNQNGTVMARPYDKIEAAKKKKEVSFSFEDDLDGLREHEISFSNNSVFGDNNINETGTHERQQSQQMRTFQLQQSLLASQPKTWTQAMAHQKANEAVRVGGHPEDNHSDTSRETVTSDSGRGGSDEDLPVSHNSSKDDKDVHFSSHGYSSGSNSLKCSLPHKYKHSRPHSTDLTQEKGPSSKPSPHYRERSPSNLIGQEKPKFTVRKPYIDREVRDSRAQSEGWVPSYV